MSVQAVIFSGGEGLVMLVRAVFMFGLAAAFLMAIACSGSCAPGEVVGAVYHSDTPFPEFMHLWQEGWSLKDANGEKLLYSKTHMSLGGYVFVYFRNTGAETLKVTDLLVQGIKLSEGIGVTETTARVEDKFGASVLLSKLPKEKTDALKTAGQPVWWKAEPDVVPPGGLGEIVIRVKRSPAAENLKIGIATGKGAIDAVVPVKKVQPRFTTIAFTPDLKTIYAYALHPKPGAKPSKLLLDDKDVTASSEIASDKSLGVSPIVIKLPRPLAWTSYHTFRAVYPDGSSAIAGIRAWGRDMVYGMWGASLSGADSSEQAAKRYLTDWATHNINCSMGMVSGPGRDYYQSDEGWAWTESIGIGRMTTWDTNGKTKPVMFFLQDEPDAHDFGTGALPATERLGSLGQWLVGWQQCLREHEPATPILLNIDNTYKPENWYMYHQLADIPCVDPYYPEQLDYVYRSNPGNLAAHLKPTYVLGVSTISQSSCRPKPLHVLLCSTKYLDGKGFEGRYPTPEEKRMEVYYAISSGAKSLSYWWFSPDSFCRGVGSDDAAAQALWKEIGLLGAEVRTAGSVITRSSPVSLPVKASTNLMARTCIAGTDTVELFLVNDDVACDRIGTVVKPVEKASATVDIPTWLTPADTFEVTYEGLSDVQWKRDGSKVLLDLGTVTVGRFVMITSDAGLRGRLQKEYDSKFAANVAKLLRRLPFRLP